MKASERSLLRFMEGNDKNFIIPVYQRNYDWGITQCKQLLNDIKNISKNNTKSYFLGSIVSIDLERDKIIIIDGQQRLTTISLLLLAMYNLLSSGKQKADLKKEQIKDEYLINKYSSDETKKIRLKPIKKDEKAFCSLFKNDNIEEEDSRIYVNYNFFKKELLKLEDLDPFFDSIKKLMIVDIELKKEEDDPQLIFESLNATGLNLSEADKIRNFILMKEAKDKQEEYYTNYWQEIEKNTHDKTSEFIRDFLSYKTRNIPNQKNVYVAFKDFLIKISDEEDFDKESFLQELKQFSIYYNFTLEPNKFNQSQEIVSLLKELQILKITVFNPALLELFDDHKKKIISKEELKKIIKTIISYVIRRAICNFPTSALSKIFLTLIRDVKDRNDFSNEKYVDILKYVLTKDQKKFPKDETLKEEFLKRDIYEMNIKHYLFNKLENYENQEKVDIEEGLNNKKYQIEHIMPQTLTDTWKKELGENWEEIHSKYKNTLGNLTLTAYNQKIRNFPFKSKKEKGFKESRFYLNSDLKDIEIFDEQVIKTRLEKLTNRAIKVWSYPKTDYSPIIEESQENFYTLEEDESDFTNKKIISFNIFEVKKEVDTWIDFYIESIKFLLNYDYGYLQKFKEIGMEKFINNNKAEFRNIGKISIKEKQEIYIEKKLSTMSKLLNLRKMIEITDFELSAFKFSIQND